MSKNAAQWAERPKFPNSHYVDARIYSDPGNFREEQDKIFNKSWIIACKSRRSQTLTTTERLLILGMQN
jgi:hypothetical protein